MKITVAMALICAAGCAEVGSAPGGGDEGALAIQDEATAFRIVDLDIRDPHIRVRFIGCIDVTDTPFFGFSVNGQIANNLTGDADGDGNYDFSPLLVFRPLDQSAASTAADGLTGACTASSPTSCSAGAGEPMETVATNTAVGTCLAPLPGTTGNYRPAVTRPVDNCFATSEGTLTLNLADIPITLSHAQVAAEYSGAPASGLVDGLLRGFISEADANATILPASLPLVGGKALSSLLGGGTGACGSNDKDTIDGVPGWWFYLNFTAQQAPWVE